MAGKIRDQAWRDRIDALIDRDPTSVFDEGTSVVFRHPAIYVPEIVDVPGEDPLNSFYSFLFGMVADEDGRDNIGIAYFAMQDGEPRRCCVSVPREMVRFADPEALFKRIKNHELRMATTHP